MNKHLYVHAYGDRVYISGEVCALERLTRTHTFTHSCLFTQAKIYTTGNFAIAVRTLIYVSMIISVPSSHIVRYSRHINSWSKFEIMDFLLDFENDLLGAEIEDLENEIFLATSNRKPYTIQARPNPMEMYNDNEFLRRFRLSKANVQFIYSMIGAELEPVASRKNFTISALDKILITLRYLATGCFYLVAADFYGVSESSVCNIVPVVVQKIAALRERFIRMPVTDDEIESNRRNFFRVAGMPCIIGALDGTLVKIQEVGGAMNKTAFFCRKQLYAINVQIICDADGKFLDIVARWPGAIHDETVFLNSRIYQRFVNGEFERNQRASILLGDGGYRAETFLATPLRATNDLNYKTWHACVTFMVMKMMDKDLVHHCD